MAINESQIVAAARQRIGNKVAVSVGEHFIPHAAVLSEMREQIMECCRLFGGSSAKKEASFTTVAPQPISAPTGLAGVASASGGVLATGTYSYEVTAIQGRDECLPSAAINVSVTGTTGSVALTWNAVTSATGYRIYGRVAGFYQLLAQVGLATWTDTGMAVGGSGPPNRTSTGGGYLQDYDVITYIGADVLEIIEVYRADAYQPDSIVDDGMVDPRTGTPSVKGTYIDFGFQQGALDSQIAMERFRINDQFTWESVTDATGRLLLRLMPPPCTAVYVAVQYLSTTEGLASLPEAARIPLEHAACAALLNGILNRTDSDPPEQGQSYRDRRAMLDLIKEQRDYYELRYRRALGQLSRNAR